MSTATVPDETDIERAYLKQGEKRYLTLENTAIDNAYGVYDYDGEMWASDPLMSKETANHMRDMRNRSAQRL